MSKKLTYAELDAERARLAKSEGLLVIALNLTLHGKPDATVQVSHEGDRWKLQLYGARRADGGFVVETFYHPGPGRPAPTLILALSNLWWAPPGNAAPAIQSASTAAWARLIGVPVISAVNR